MKKFLTVEFSTFLLRISLAIILLAHSLYLKLIVFTLSGTANYFVAIGLPEFLAFFVFMMEVIVGFTLLFGVKVRAFSLLIIPICMGATWAHSANGWLFSNISGGWEYPLLLTILFVVQAGLGAGKYSIDGYLISQKGKMKKMHVNEAR